jgi:4-amino-4-deoxy-L-arabinose transferase-like glycosyltransferase
VWPSASQGTGLTARLLVLPRRRLIHCVQFAVILALALVLRLMVVAVVVFFYPRNWLFSKAPDLVFLANSLRQGQGLSSPFGGSTGPSAFVAPGYPAILGALFFVFGRDSAAAGAAMMALQLLFAMMTVALILHVADRRFGRAVAMAAGAFWAVSPPLLWLPVVLWETSLSILLLTGMVALALYGLGHAGPWYWPGVGVYCGAAMLVNPSLAPALCAMLGWTIYQTRTKPLLCWLTLLAVFAPWPLRNAYALHAFIPFRSNFGYELWQGNHEGASGLFEATLEPLKNAQEYAAYADQGELVYMRRKGALAHTYLRTHPGMFLTRSTERAIRFWAGAGSHENNFVIEWHAIVTSLLGWAGAALLYRQDRRLAWLFLLPLLLFPLPYYVTHPDFRFRLVLDPLLTILSAYAVVRSHTLLKTYGRP